MANSINMGVFSAKVLSTLYYGDITDSTIWLTGIRDESREFPNKKKNLVSLTLLQNNYLRRNTGEYKCCPRIALEREIIIAPRNLYIKVTVL